jgi:hypothetical protein
MNACPKCGHQVVRTQRTRLQKVFFSAAFRCSHCTYRTQQLHPAVDVNLRFIFSRFTRCMRCGHQHVHRLAQRDRLDPMSKHPMSVLLRLTGAPLRKCPFCRLQYCDWRSRVPAVRRANQPS